MPPAGIDKLKHIVVLMMENRSFDHMLGFMMGPNYPIDGLTGNEFNRDSTGTSIKVSNDAKYATDLWPDPGHAVCDVNQQIFGTIDPAPSAVADMSGFITNYESKDGNTLAGARKIMKCFTPGKISVLCALAQQFCVCDRWFSSVPGPTFPNRSYAHAATSIGRVDMGLNWLEEAPTIYELLAANNVSSRIFYHDTTMAMTFKHFLDGQNTKFGQIQDFYDDCNRNTLPTYCFLEPRFGPSKVGGNFLPSDQHPDHNVLDGEQLIFDVFNAVWKNQAVRESTLLVIVYDEHGGLYDHVIPPSENVANPDDKEWAGDPANSPDPAFDFRRLGVRVPAVLISPFIAPMTIDRTQYDHTSIIATARQLFVPDWKNNFLTKRDQQANCIAFDDIFSLDVARADPIDLTKFQPPVHTAQEIEAVLSRTPSDHLKALVNLAADLQARRLPPAQRSQLDPVAAKASSGAAAAFLGDVMTKLRESDTGKAETARP
jgi:phospholipase C